MRVQSLRRRIRALIGLRKLVAIPADRDLSAAQWQAIHTQLAQVATRIETKLDRATRRHAAEASAVQQRALRVVLGELDLETTQAYCYFDTFMDVLTQRLSPELGLLLKGCDVLATDGLAFEHPALRLAGEPIVYCDRGMGAAVVRSAVIMDRVARNPLPLIQLPYARLQEKYNLASLLHEVGHEALVRLHLRARLVNAMRRQLEGYVPRAIRDRYAQWTLELGPDFWAFGCTGAAQAATVRDVLQLPPVHAFTLSTGAVHPPVYLRVLMAFHWCRRSFGLGPWDDWEAEWRATYRLSDAPGSDRQFLALAEAAIPRASGVFFDAPLAPLEQRALVELFDLRAVAPARLSSRLREQSSDSFEFRSMRPVAQLAAFRLLRENPRVSEAQLDDAMRIWLFRLAAVRRLPRGES